MSGRSSTSDQDIPVMHGEFMALVNDVDSQDVLRIWASRQGFPSATVQLGGPDLFAQMLENSPPPKMAIIDIDGQIDPAKTVARLIGLVGPESKLVIIGSANDVGLYRQMIGAGAVDYLVKPLVADLLNQALAAVLRGQVGGKGEGREAKIVIFIGVRGGVGTTTVAVNSGWLLAHEFRKDCALLDLDLQFGTSALSLDLEPGRGLRDIVNSPHRVDALMIASSLVPESDQFSVLGAEEAVDEMVPMDGGAITALFKEMRSNFDFILVDMPRHLLATQKRLLAMADSIVLVTEFSLAGIRDTLRIKNAIHALGCPGTIIIAGSRVGSAHQVDTAAFEKGAQMKIDFIIPADDKILAQAANGGKALGAIASNAPVTKAIRTLANKISGTDPAAAAKKSGGFFDNLLGQNKKKKKISKEVVSE
jgi:pilus assembly protein CpaE